MVTLEQSIEGYAYGIKNFYPGDGEAGCLNSERRYLETQLDALSNQERQTLAEIDALALKLVKQVDGTWEEDEMRDLADFILATRAQQNAA
jgi:cytochrome c553